MRQPSGFIACVLMALALIGVTLLSIARRGAEPVVSPGEYWGGMAIAGVLIIAGIALLSRAQRP